MAKDYFQDIITPNDSDKYGAISPDGNKKINARAEPGNGGGRSIRNITVNPRAARTRGMSGDMRVASVGMSQPQPEKPHLQGKRRAWIWVVAAISVLVLVFLVLFAFRSTTITITPRSRPVVFDQSILFKANPSASATAGTLSYSVVANDFEDSAVVPSSGTEHAEERASGTIEVYNSYSASKVTLIKNTRFETPDGLIFRVPAAVVIPGKKGSTPGSVTVTVSADQAGERYNVGPVDKFTLPGLKTSLDMYAGVYARSTSQFTGGFSGERPAVASGALEAAKAEVRGRLASKARDSARTLNNANSTVFSDLIRITYTSLASTVEAGGGLRIHERAHVEIPIFQADNFAQIVASGAGENVDGASFALVGLDRVVARMSGTGTATSLGKSSIEFTLAGNSALVWDVDSSALSAALAGRDQNAFQGIINGFPNIQEARARIEPFWKGTFPESASDIVINFIPVQAMQ
jgi:hypothetical protein